MRKIEFLIIRPSEITILNLTPGQEYDFTFLTVGNYGKNSSTITVTQSLYTDDVTSYNTVPSVNRIEFNIQLGSGLGRNVRVDLTSDDYPQFLRTTFDTFRWVLVILLVLVIDLHPSKVIGKKPISKCSFSKITVLDQFPFFVHELLFVTNLIQV